MKYELLKDPIILDSHNKAKVFRIRALEDFCLCNGGNVFKGQLGGCISDYNNLSQDGSCWVDYDALVLDSARVEENGLLLGSAIAMGEAIIKGNAIVSENACIMDNATVKEHAVISDEASIKEYAIVNNFAKVSGSAMICGDTVVAGSANISGHAIVKNSAASAFAIVSDFAIISDNAEIYGTVKGYARISDSAVVCADAVVCGNAVINGPIDIKKGAFLKNSVFESRCLFDGCKYNFPVPPIETNKDTKALLLPLYPMDPDAPIDKPSLVVFTTDDKIVNIALTHENVGAVEDFSLFFPDYNSFFKYLKEELTDMEAISKPVNDKCINFLFDWLKNEGFSVVPSIAKNLFTKMVLFSPNKKEKNALSSKKGSVCELLSAYILSQFAGIYLYGIKMFISYDPSDFFDNTRYDYTEFLSEVLNAASLDIPSKSFFLDPSSIAYNEHMVYAVKKVCNFTHSWENCVLNSLSKIKEVPVLKLYCE